MCILQIYNIYFYLRGRRIYFGRRLGPKRQELVEKAIEKPHAFSTIARFCWLFLLSSVAKRQFSFVSQKQTDKNLRERCAIWWFARVSCRSIFRKNYEAWHFERGKRTNKMEWGNWFGFVFTFVMGAFMCLET